MSTQQELIAAALTECDLMTGMLGYEPASLRDLREACARAMVQPAAPDMAERDQFRDAAKMVQPGIPTEDQIQRHKIRAGDCPPDSEVLLVRSVRRFAEKAAPQPVGEPADPDPLHLSRILHELAGAASMCWTPRPSTAEFDSQQAIVFVEQAIAEIRQRMQMMSPAPQPVGEDRRSAMSYDAIDAAIDANLRIEDQI